MTVARISRGLIGRGARVHFVASLTGEGRKTLCGRRVTRTHRAGHGADCRVCRRSVGLPDR